MLPEVIAPALLPGTSREVMSTPEACLSRSGCPLRTRVCTGTKAILHQCRRREITSLPTASVSWVLLYPRLMESLMKYLPQAPSP